MAKKLNGKGKKAYEVLRELQAKDPNFGAGVKGSVVARKAKGDQRKTTAKRMAQSLTYYPDVDKVAKKIDQMPKPAPKAEAGKPKVSKKALKDEHPKVTAAKRKAERKEKKPKKERQPKPKPVVHEFDPKDIERIVDEVMQATGIPAGKKKSYMKFLTVFSKQNDRRQSIRIKLHKVRTTMMENLLDTLK